MFSTRYVIESLAAIFDAEIEERAMEQECETPPASTGGVQIDSPKGNWRNRNRDSAP